MDKQQILKRIKEINEEIQKYLQTKPLNPQEDLSGETSKDLKRYKELREESEKLHEQLRNLE